MSLLVFQHEADESISALGQTLMTHGHRLRVVQLHRGEPVPPDLDNVDGVISLGGDAAAYEPDRHPYLRPEMDYLKRTHEAGVPVVGICLGAQLIAAALGGEVAAMEKPEAGWENVKLAFPGTIDPIYAGLTWDSMQFHLHGDQVTKLPPGATPLAGSKACRNQAFKVGLRTYAFQYHFEWTQADLQRVSRHPLMTKAGVSPETVAQQTTQHYAEYRRQGDRLAETLTLLLLPIDRRVRHAAAGGVKA